VASFTPRGKSPQYPMVGPQSRTENAVEKRKFYYPYRESILDYSVVQPVVLSLFDSAVPAFLFGPIIKILRNVPV
jgi:hypothetical protein